MRKTVDMLLENGRIYTMVSEGDCVEALCVKDGVIVYTGTAAEAERLYDAAEVVDLGGRVMLPGMGDSHLHFFAYCQTHTSVDLGGCRSREEAIALLKARADETPKGPSGCAARTSTSRNGPTRASTCRRRRTSTS